MPPKRRVRRSRRRRAPRVSRLQILQVGLILLLAASAYVVWLDSVIREQFEGTKWALPARVFARPLELFPGRDIDRSAVIDELQRLGYQEVSQAEAPGQFERRQSALRIYTRDFQFWDSRETPQLVALEFGHEGLLKIRSPRSGSDVSLVRLDPLEIAKIYPSHHEDRIFVAIENVPPVLIDAIVSTEDKRFFQHKGLDFRSIARAFAANLRSLEIRQGGSTLTQQLVKNFFLTRERSFIRKINEALMALLLERRYSKWEILEAYVNEIYLGQDGRRAIHGFAVAAPFYFGRPLAELRTEEIALLVALAKGASYYDPRRHPERALSRRNFVLEAMAAEGKLSRKAADRCKHAPIRLSARPGGGGEAYPAFMNVLRSQLKRDYRDADLRAEGLRIFATLDPVVQAAAEAAVPKGIERLEQARDLPPDSLQAALVATEPNSGEILAIIGGRRPQYAGFNRAVEAHRPVGSLIKPAVYLAALRKPDRFSVATLVDDAPIEMQQADGTLWRPSNYDGRTHGRITLEEALVHSYNLATVNVGLQVGYAPFRKALQDLGVDAEVPAYPSVFLGALELSPLQVAEMYQTFASGGFRTPLRAIRSVLDRDGNRLSRYPLKTEQTLSPSDAYLMNYLLSKVVSKGTARSAGAKLVQRLPLAGKTGTTNDLRDSWFAGYGADLQVVVWLGRDDNKPARLSGATGALQIWTDVMQSLRPRAIELTPPEEIRWHWVEPGSQVLLDSQCGRAVWVPLRRSQVSAPPRPCDATGAGGGRLLDAIRSLWR